MRRKYGGRKFDLSYALLLFYLNSGRGTGQTKGLIIMCHVQLMYILAINCDYYLVTLS